MVFFSGIFSRRSSGTLRSERNVNVAFAEIEAQLVARSDALLQDWQRDAEQKMGESVSSLMNGLLESLGSQLGAKTAAPRIDLGDVLGASSGLDRALRPLENQVNGWIRNTIDEWFSSEKTTVNASQSTRSQEAIERFRQSRSQQQADAATQTQQGQRNL